MERKVILFVSLIIITLTLLLFSSCKTVEAWSYFVTTNTFIYKYIYIYIYIYIFGLELAQMKLDELVKDVMNLDNNKKSMDDNRSHSQD